MATFEDVKAWATTFYASNHAVWFQNSGKSRATLKVEAVAAEDGYSPSADTIWLCVEGHDIEDATDGVADWPTWKSSLVHEMLHEYQHKLSLVVSSLAKDMYAQHQLSSSQQKTPFGFSGRGHDEAYYEAICIQAPRFGLSPDQLQRKI